VKDISEYQVIFVRGEVTLDSLLLELFGMTSTRFGDILVERGLRM
jgi:hypothetical protein